jgi:hypothetical protein
MELSGIRYQAMEDFWWPYKESRGKYVCLAKVGQPSLLSEIEVFHTRYITREEHIRENAMMELIIFPARASVYIFVIRSQAVP